MVSVKNSKGERKVKGIPVSPGIHLGYATVEDPLELIVTSQKITKVKIEKEILKFRNSCDHLITHLEELKRGLPAKLQELIDAEIMIMEDTSFRRKVENLIRREERAADYAVKRVLTDMAQAIEERGTSYMKEKGRELRNLAREMIYTLRRKVERTRRKTKGDILVAEELSIYDAFRAIEAGFKAFVTGGGGKTSHSALVLRNFKLPAVFGIGECIRDIRDENQLIVDGTAGTVVVNPSEETLDEFAKKKEEFEEFRKSLLKIKDEPPLTIDKKEIRLLINIDFVEELEIMKDFANYGIGLFRTESLFFTQPLGEDDQAKLYQEIARKVYPNPFTIRAFDLGGDKILERPERNPFLGMRGIRLLLKEKELFETQVRAVLRANTKKNIRFMVPMVSSFDEVLATKRVIDEAEKELRKGGLKVNRPEFGVMIETPAAIFLMRDIARLVQFVSIGTNDLTQFVLGVDRRNPNVSYLFNHFHPSFLRLVKMAIEEAKRHGLKVGVCGEMASDFYAIPLLIALDIDELSVPPPLILEVKDIVRGTDTREAKELLRKSLSARSEREVSRILESYFRNKFPRMLSFYSI